MVLCCVVLRCVALRCAALRCTALHCTALHCILLSCRVVSCRVVSCRVVSCRIVSCRIVSYRIVLYVDIQLTIILSYALTMVSFHCRLCSVNQVYRMGIYLHEISLYGMGPEILAASSHEFHDNHRENLLERVGKETLYHNAWGDLCPVWFVCFELSLICI